MQPTLSIVSRKEWGADLLKDPIPLIPPVPFVLHTYTDSKPCYTKEDCIKELQELQKAHIEEGSYDIKQNFLIGGDGRVYEGRGWNGQPEYHQCYVDHWERSIEIAHFGYSGIPPGNILATAETLIDEGVNLKYIKEGYRCTMSFEEGVNDRPNNSEDNIQELPPEYDPMNEKVMKVEFH